MSIVELVSCLEFLCFFQKSSHRIEDKQINLHPFHCDTTSINHLGLDSTSTHSYASNLGRKLHFASHFTLLTSHPSPIHLLEFNLPTILHLVANHLLWLTVTTISIVQPQSTWVEVSSNHCRIPLIIYLLQKASYLCGRSCDDLHARSRPITTLYNNNHHNFSRWVAEWVPRIRRGKPGMRRSRINWRGIKCCKEMRSKCFSLVSSFPFILLVDLAFSIARSDCLTILQVLVNLESLPS